MDRIKRFLAFLGLLLAVGAIAVVSVAVSNISPDAQSMGLGVMMGCGVGIIPMVTAGIVALIVARARAVNRDRRMMQSQYGSYSPQLPYAQQPPVIVVGGGAGGMMQPYNPYPQYGNPGWDMTPTSNRQFDIIGAEGQESQ